MIIDCQINNRSVKRPDSSFHLYENSIPQPPPGWLKFMANGAPYPNIVVEVVVNHESPNKLMRDCQRYFSATTSVRLWIGVEYWKAGKKFWVGYAVRRVGGVGATVTSQFRFPPNHHDINGPTTNRVLCVDGRGVWTGNYISSGDSRKCGPSYRYRPHSTNHPAKYVGGLDVS